MRALFDGTTPCTGVRANNPMQGPENSTPMHVENSAEKWEKIERNKMTLLSQSISRPGDWGSDGQFIKRVIPLPPEPLMAARGQARQGNP